LTKIGSNEEFAADVMYVQSTVIVPAQEVCAQK
jgi:hypothetical protein